MLKVAWSPVYAHPLPEGHRFPMEKYNLIPEQLLYEGTISQANLFEPGPLAEADILTTHTAAYWEGLRSLSLSPREFRKIGFPPSPELIFREIVIAQGTVDCARFARIHGIAMNVSGGTHHAYADRGEGFCLLNDIAIAANVLLRDGLAQRILVVDLDVHQGNGTAAIFQGNPHVFTFSMHCHGNYPMEKEASDLDIALPPGTGDAAFLGTLADTLPQLLAQFKPDFAFYLSGVDVLATDKLGRFAMTREGCKERDRLVLDSLRGAGIPVAVSMGGGYSVHVRDIVEAHCNTFRLAAAWADARF
ncbi:MAG TPA: histone deacetylase [Bacteroidia bacterium]|nr:histone deacetylase [Bacteroidia bacterium]